MMLIKERKIKETLMLMNERKIEEPMMLRKERKIEEPIMLKKQRNIKEPMEVYKEGKSRLVRISKLKMFRRVSINVHGFPSDSPHLAVLETDKMGEILKLINKLTGRAGPVPTFSSRSVNC